MKYYAIVLFVLLGGWCSCMAIHREHELVVRLAEVFSSEGEIPERTRLRSFLKQEFPAAEARKAVTERLAVFQCLVEHGYRVTVRDHENASIVIVNPVGRERGVLFSFTFVDGKLADILVTYSLSTTRVIP